MGLPTTFDSSFLPASAKYGIPTAYLRALAFRLSQLDPAKKRMDGSEGIFQISPALLSRYNKESGSQVKPDEMGDPSKNSMVAAWLLSRVVRSYQGIEQNWLDPNYVSLVTLGYLAGYNNIRGVGYVLKGLEQAGIDKLNAITVYQAAQKMARANPGLKDPRVVNFATSIVKTYGDEIGLAVSFPTLGPGETPKEPETKTGFPGWIIPVAGAGLLFALAKK